MQIKKEVFFYFEYDSPKRVDDGRVSDKSVNSCESTADYPIIPSVNVVVYTIQLLNLFNLSLFKQCLLLYELRLSQQGYKKREPIF